MAKIKLFIHIQKSSLVTALQAEKGGKFSHPLCQVKRILRKSCKEGPSSRRHRLIDYIMELFYGDENKGSNMFENVKLGWFFPKCEMGIKKK